MYNDMEKLIQKDLIYKGNGFTNKLPSGIITLDIALGGGIPLNGSIIELYGEESAGKTTVAYRFCRRCTKNEKGYVTWVDSELSYDSSWAIIQGVDIEKLIPYRPPYMEAANNIILEDIRRYKETYLPWLVNDKWSPNSELASEAGTKTSDIEGVKKYMIENSPPHLIVWDSLAASPVKSVAEEGADFASGMSYRARLIKSFLSRYSVSVVGCDKIGLIIINQVIDDIGSYGGGITTPGGRGLRHGKHLSIYIKKLGSGEKDKDQFTVTDYVKLSITKNKVTPIIASFPIIFSKSKGYIGATALLEYLIDIKWFKDAGSWKKFTYENLDKSTGEIKREELSIQRGTFYKLIAQRPEIFVYLCNVVKDMFVSKFPMNKSLQNINIENIISSCLEESTAIPTEEETSSIKG
jgi:recombination protein RecA